MKEIFDIENINVEVYYEGKLVEKTFFEDNPELKKIYPTLEQINNIRHQIKLQRRAGIQYTIVVSEFGIKINEK